MFTITVQYSQKTQHVVKMETKTITISTLITLGIIVSALVGPVFFEEDKYYCESKPELGLFECDGFSKYVDPNGKCLNATREDISYGNKICRTGWTKVIEDTIINDTEIKTNAPQGAYSYICNQKECVLNGN